MAMIELHNLTKRFGALLAVDGLSFTVEAGSVVGFLGPNGAGKTTTLRMLLGLVQPSGGEARICGRPYRELVHPLRHVGAVLDGSAPHPARTARCHLRIQAMAAGLASSRADDALRLVGLSQAAERRVGEFSLGMRQRLSLAAALLPDPQVLVLDEPANGLDPRGVRWLRDLLRERAANGCAVLVSSHILTEVAQTVDSVVIIDRGRLLAQASLDELTAPSLVRLRSPRAAVLVAALRADGARVRLTGRERLEVSDSSAERIAEVATQLGVPIVESATETPSLEEVFLALTATNATRDDLPEAGQHPMQKDAR